jgi:diaminopropionate ammonia-lyase
VPRNVMRGYCVLAHEAVVEQWRQGPTHVFVQAGVGGLAAAVIGYLWAVMPERPSFIVVEPKSADCWFQSNAVGKPALASGDANTVMGGLACREISPVTWPIVGEATDWFMTIEEDEVTPARRLFAHPHGDDPAVASGPSGCAGLAGLLRVCADKSAFEALKLDRRSRVLLINSEGNLGEQPA